MKTYQIPKLIKAVVAVSIALAFIMPSAAFFTTTEKTNHINITKSTNADWEMTIGDTYADPGDQIEVEMTGVWSDALGGFSGFVYYDTDKLTFVDSIWTGTPFENIMNKFTLENPVGYLSIGMVVFFEEYPEADATTIVKLIFDVDPAASGQADLTFDPEKDNVYSYTNGSTVPAVTYDGAVYIGGQPPNTPSDPSPVDSATDVEVDVDLSWTGGDPEGDPLTYEVYFGDVTPPPYVDTVSTESYDPGTLGYETTYYWQIMADDGVFTIPGPIWSFTTMSAGTMYTLSVDIVGQGSVTPPSGSTYPEGTEVEIEAFADLGWAFTGWSGDLVSIDNPETILMDSDKEITATFEEIMYTLTVGIVGDGSVDVDPLGPYSYGTEVTLTANPGVDWEFGSWSGDLSGSDNPESIFMTANKDVTATFYEVGTNNPPYTPSNPDPADGEDEAPAGQITISWDGGDPDVSDTVTYEIYGGINPDNLILRHTVGPYPATQTRITHQSDLELIHNVTFYWKIIAEDNNGARSEGPIWSYTTEELPPNEPPYTPSNPNPMDGADDVSITTDLTWSGGDPNGDYLTYDIYFGTSSPPSYIATVDNVELYDLSTLEYETTYYWKIVANDFEFSSEGPIWSFSTEPIPNDPPYVPSSPSPADGSTDNDIDVDLSWTGGDPDGDPLDYHVYFGDASPPSFAGTVSEESFNTGPLDYEKTYYWKIIADDGHDTTEGPEWTFSTLNLYDLTVDVVGNGHVDLNPVGGTYVEGTTVTLTAVADEGWEFIRWNGALTGSENPETIIMDSDKEVTATFEEIPKIPDLDADGDLTWSDVTPGDTVTAEIDVENIGDAESLLDWEVDSYPDWGTWSFDPDNGIDLTPEDGEVTIDITVVAPDESEQTFTGTVKLVNSEDSDDYVEIDVSLATPRVRNSIRNIFIEFLEQLVERFPLLEQLPVITRILHQ